MSANAMRTKKATKTWQPFLKRLQRVSRHFSAARCQRPGWENMPAFFLKAVVLLLRLQKPKQDVVSRGEMFYNPEVGHG